MHDDPVADFGPEGPLARQLPHYRPREGQLQMAADVADALWQQSALVAEAGTGVGKTYAYLVPLLRDGRRAIVATHTRSLQDQLYFQDLPRLQAALGTRAAVALLKGRGNYYCHQRAETARPRDRGDGAVLAALRQWVAQHESGDLDQFDGLPADWPLKSQVTSTVDNCLGHDCPFIEQCCVYRARAQAAKAQVVVANHHLLAADLALKDRGFGDLLARAAAVVVDEAHKWPEVLGLFFGFVVSSYQLHEIYADWQALELPWGELEAPLLAVLDASAELQRAVPSQPERLDRSQALEDAAFAGRLQGLQAALDEVAQRASRAAQGPAQSALAARLMQVYEACANWETAAAEAAICWAQRSRRGYTLHSLPLDVSRLSQAGFAAQQASWIFVSATLSLGGDFGYFVERLGLQEAHCARYPSPFEHHRQGRLYVPRGPGAPGYGLAHTQAVIEQALPLIDVAGGGSFVLCTSRRAVEEAARLLREARPALRVLVQGEEANGLLLERFRRDGAAVLVGSASFWEGVDVPGDALRLVVIDRLPFAPQNDPVYAARRRLVEARGLSAFMRVDLPPAAVALQQAVGRLIRSEADHGVVMLGDRRLLSKGYGRTLRASLPAFPLIEDETRAVDFLRDTAGGAAISA